MKPSLYGFSIGGFRNFAKGFFCDLGERRQRVLAELAEGVWKKGTLQVVGAARASEGSGASSSQVWAASKCSYRHLSSRKWDMDKPARRYREYASKGIHSDDLIVVDLGDIQKPSSKKMAFVTYVRDGSKDEVGRGYWLFESCVVRGRHDILPLENFLYSLDAPGTRSENTVILEALGRILDSTKGQGVFVADRGFDREEFFNWLDAKNARYVFRLRGDRSLRDPWGKPLGSASDFAATMPLAQRMRVTNPRTGKKRWLSFAFQEVRRPGCKRPLWLVVAVDSVDEERFLLLAVSVPVLTKAAAERVIRWYFLRWTVEEYHKALKTGTGVEKAQLTTYARIHSLVGILAIVALRLLSMKLLAKALPDAPITEEVIGPDFLEVLEARFGTPKGGWTYRTTLVTIARLGGFPARKFDRLPGWITIWRGWQKLIAMVEGVELIRAARRRRGNSG